MCKEKVIVPLDEEDIKVGDLESKKISNKHVDRWLISRTFNTTCKFVLKADYLKPLHEI